MGCNRPIINKNFLQLNNFAFQIHKMPHVEFFVQAANIPSIGTGPVEEGTPISATIPFQGDHPTWGNFEITFLVDEDMKSYLEVWEWLVGISFPQNFLQYKRMKQGGQEPYDIPEFFNNRHRNFTESDATLFIYTNKANKNIEINFTDLHPVGLSEIRFDTTTENIEYAKASASFRFLFYDIKPTHYYDKEC